MKLSIILPIKNEAAGIIKTLDLIVTNIGEIDYEIVVVNDFSDDNSYDVINNKKESNDKIKLFNNNKKGLGGVINKGIAESTGEIICIMMVQILV